jgi:tRNA uridine 5-carboxymethylaminomethyl modification enzyme
MPYAKNLGLVGDELYTRFLAEEEVIAKSVKIINDSKKAVGILDLFRVFVFDESARNAARAKLLEVLAEKEIDAKALSSRALTRIYAEIIYAGYIEKEQREVEKVIKNKNIKIPEDFSYENLPGLSTELTKKLTFYKPATLADSELIPGMTPAGVSLILFHLNQRRKNI